MFCPVHTSHQIDDELNFFRLFFFFNFLNSNTRPMFNGRTERVHLDKYGCVLCVHDAKGNECDDNINRRSE